MASSVVMGITNQMDSSGMAKSTPIGWETNQMLCIDYYCNFSVSKWDKKYTFRRVLER